MRKILVPLKRVPDHTLKIRINEDRNGIKLDNIKWIINPFDEIAVEEAVRLKEKFPETEVVIASIGPKECSEQIRSAFAIGADRAILVVTDEYVDSYLASVILKEIFKKDSYQLVIMGKQAIDSDANQTGQLLSAHLGVSQATFASKILIDDTWQAATVTREIDGGLETLKITLPAIITTDLRLNEPRYPTLAGIVKAKKKPIDEISLDSLNIKDQAQVKIIKLEEPPPRKAGKIVTSVDELINMLKGEAKVIR